MKKNLALQTLRAVGSVVVMICLCVTLFAGMLYFSLGGFLTDANAYISIADKAQEKNGFYSDMYKNACERLVSRGTLGGFPKETFDGLLEYDYAVSSFKEYVRFIVNEPNGKFTLPEFDEKLRAACLEYASSAEAKADGFSATEKEIEDFVKYIDSQVVAIIALPFFAGVYPAVDAVYQTRVVAVVIVCFVIAAGIFFGLLCLLERGKVINAVRQALYALSGAGIMTIVVGVFLDVLNGNEFFNFSSQAVLDYLNIYKDALSLRINILGIVIATVGVAATACIAVFSGRKKNEEKEILKNPENTNIEKTENINNENN